MIFLDTNILIRLATADDKRASEEAASFIAKQPKKSLEIIDAVLVEVCFVLEFHDYKMKREDICDFLGVVYDFSQIKSSEKQRQTLKLFRENPQLDFADCVLLRLSDEMDNSVYTFDQDLQQACT